MDSTNTIDGNGEAVATSVGLAGGPKAFTPGPWGAYLELKSGGLHTIWTEDENGDPAFFTTLIARTCFAPASEPNARLIATAPDGLALAQEIVRALSTSTGREVLNSTRYEMEPIRQMALKIIAKATGEPANNQALPQGGK